MTKYNDNLQYNSCVYKGICSINPRTSALQNVLGVYLHLCAKYCLKLEEKDSLNPKIKKFILNLIAISISNSDFTEECFMEAISGLKELFPKIIKTYNDVYNKDDFKDENILDSDIFQKSSDIVEAIKFGEYIFKTKISNLSVLNMDLLKILMILSKSISINLIDLESYKINDKEAFKMLLLIFSTVDTDVETDNIKTLIYKSAKINTVLMDKLHAEQEKRYGKQKITDVSYTTTPSKAVLTVGSNIKELEDVLESLKNTDIDVYTHDDMMVAHTFPKFGEYKNLKGQYGHGVENCLIDFATFPGPIILTKHSLHNIENLYRGRLFTTDENFYKGVIKIENNDFSEVISSADNSKGFKKGKSCETVTVGYDYDKCVELIKDKLNTNKYKKVVVIGLKDYSSKHRDYFEKMIKLISNDILIISFSYNFTKNNLLHFNVCFDAYAVVRMVSYILNFNIPMDIFLPKCGKNTLAEMIYFAQFEKNTIYMGECEPIIINPSIQNTLKEVFKIKTINSAKKDSEEVNKL